MTTFSFHYITIGGKKKRINWSLMMQTLEINPQFVVSAQN